MQKSSVSMGAAHTPSEPQRSVCEVELVDEVLSVYADARAFAALAATLVSRSARAIALSFCHFDLVFL